MARAEIREVRVQGVMFPPERIVCLTEETVETLYLLWNTGMDATGRFPSWSKRFI